MQKLWLIIRREYLARVRRRAFVLTTLLTPFAVALFFAIVFFIFSYEGDETRRILVVDESNVTQGILKDEKQLYFRFSQTDLEATKAAFDGERYDGILYLPPLSDLTSDRYELSYFADDQLGLDTRLTIENKINRSLRDYKIRELQLDPEVVASLDVRSTIDPEPLNETDTNDSSITSFIAAGIGGVMGFMMYITVFVYGMMVMRGVMEEKTNRIVEVMMSTVRPFQLMLGKIIGVGMVGLTQVLVWAIMIPTLIVLVNLLLGVDPSAMQNTPGAMGTAPEIDPEDAQFIASQIIDEFGGQNWWFIVPAFIFYFLGGYFLYASAFAAVGSAMGDDLGESQGLTIPITIPVVLAFYIMFVAIQSPNSSLAVWSSIFPLFSPIVMPARLAFEPPMWQVLLSMAVLLATAILFIWLSARIYRVGILLYGKKTSLRELVRWMFSRA